MKTKTIAIQGVKGAFHEEAARNFFEEEIEILPCMTFQEVGEAVLSGKADQAIMAIENTISGTILSNLELIRDHDLEVAGESKLRIHQHLGAVQGASLESLREVRSHYMALEQCQEFFRPHAHIQLVQSVDTALSLREVSEAGELSRGAIGSKLAIEHYGLELLAEAIESDPNNYTRFVVLDRKGQSPQEGDKISIALVLAHQRGTLARVISLLDLTGSSLTKIESVPIVGRPFQYGFFIDFLLGEEVNLDTTLQVLRPHVLEISVLGRYPSDKTTFS